MSSKLPIYEEGRICPGGGKRKVRQDEVRDGHTVSV